ncbi:HRDC-like protein [Auriculariales sp. MPI-PUGE-AT-0066]|nr:HRDC-like protein [Auriculariales sp. MPI-PUGE-AT-0066]
MSTPRLGRRTHNEEEDAAVLKLGSEFNTAGCLLISEVQILLEHKKDNAPDTAVYNKTLDYVRTFSKFSTQENAQQVRMTLQQAGLTQFETAQIANLVPVDVDEAKSVIPSLSKLEDDRLQELLDQVQSLRRFQA